MCFYFTPCPGIIRSKLGELDFALDSPSTCISQYFHCFLPVEYEIFIIFSYFHDFMTKKLKNSRCSKMAIFDKKRRVWVRIFEKKRPKKWHLYRVFTQNTVFRINDHFPRGFGKKWKFRKIFGFLRTPVPEIFQIPCARKNRSDLEVPGTEILVVPVQGILDLQISDFLAIICPVYPKCSKMAIFGKKRRVWVRISEKKSRKKWQLYRVFAKNTVFRTNAHFPRGFGKKWKFCKICGFLRVPVPEIFQIPCTRKNRSDLEVPGTGIFF